MNGLDVIRFTTGMQRNLASGRIEQVLFGRNEAPLHHYHQTFRKALGLPPLGAVG